MNVYSKQRIFRWVHQNVRYQEKSQGKSWKKSYWINIKEALANLMKNSFIGLDQETVHITG